jgi:hypothetical protein
MEQINIPDIYELNQLIERLEDIYNNEITPDEKYNTVLNLPKAFYSMALEIRDLKEQFKDHLRSEHDDPPY